MKGLQLLATGGALPGRVVTNEDLRRQVDTSDEWITTRTGICQRYYCTERGCCHAGCHRPSGPDPQRSGGKRHCLPKLWATLSAPTATSSIACRVQVVLGPALENRPAFDVNAACSGFIYAAAAHGPEHAGRAVCAGHWLRGTLPHGGPD